MSAQKGRQITKADEWEDDDMTGVDAMPGGSPGVTAGGSEELASMLLEMTAVSLKMAILLSELDEDEWQTIAPRLVQFFGVVQQIPQAPTRKAKRVGFRPPAKQLPQKKRPVRKRK